MVKVMTTIKIESVIHGVPLEYHTVSPVNRYLQHIIMNEISRKCNIFKLLLHFAFSTCFVSVNCVNDKLIVCYFLWEIVYLHIKMVHWYIFLLQLNCLKKKTPSLELWLFAMGPHNQIWYICVCSSVIHDLIYRHSLLDQCWLSGGSKMAGVNDWKLMFQ